MVAVEDGRRLRREQNREAVLDALGDLFAEGVLQPGTTEIAERAGISARSLFRYFEDLDDLAHAAIDRQLAAARPLLDVPAAPSDPVAVRIAALVEARATLYESVAPAARAARATAHRRSAVAEQLRESRAYLRRQVRTLFSGASAEALAAVDVLCSFESYELLRRDQGLSRRRATAVLTVALTGLLA